MNYLCNLAPLGLALAVLCGGCVPDTQEGGSIVETDGNVQTSNSGGGSGESSGTPSETTGTSKGSTQSSDSDPGTGSSTGDLVPAACVEQGWDTSFEAWQTAVADGGGSYFYVARTESYSGKTEIDCFYDTTIRVEDGVVVERSFAVFDSLEGANCEEPFTETADQIGESDVPFAVAPVALDQIYLDCCNNHLDLPSDEFLILFDVDDAGLLEYCGAQDLGCGESCEVQESGLINIVEHGFGT